MVEITLDRTDWRILAELQRDCRLTNQELAGRVALSPSPCLRRVKRLEAAGVIRQYVALVDAQKVGFGLAAYIEVRLQKQLTDSYAPLEEFARAVQRWPEVAACYATTGDMDYLLRVQVEDLAHFSRFALDTLMQHPSVVDIRSSFVLKTIKETTAVGAV
ncbi:Lrp/AsnC family transcriptional regulator [Verticiella sediminum]|uniref:Lrp/AsnC family transcriptional regulator n=1 Tax=Verticiella sediminum TaxID=1247510 RepID=A0A556A849_9BURK|nr:Lrp/AsnC family transcriptional regulator [Verticiella sediminum]TSH89074.1 Lrp/AsnC family transcriptional regulator [Verticiella sediminum]